MSKETLVKMAKEKSNLGTAANVGLGAAAVGAGGYIAKKGLKHHVFGGLEQGLGKNMGHSVLEASGKARALKGRVGMLAGGALAAAGLTRGGSAIYQRLKKD